MCGGGGGGVPIGKRGDLYLKLHINGGGATVLHVRTDVRPTLTSNLAPPPHFKVASYIRPTYIRGSVKQRNKRPVDRNTWKYPRFQIQEDNKNGDRVGSIYIY